jgi:hypothetical protein
MIDDDCMKIAVMGPRIFLLSPADCRGRRARHVMTEEATSSLAVRLRSQTGVPLGELFAYLSGLYFRGKVTYARRFASVPNGSGVLIITPGRGLLPDETATRLETLEAFGNIEIRSDNPDYCNPLEASARRLSARFEDATARFVLLGSVASDKYVDVLGRVLGSRLVFPADFVGRGDMSRGGLLLRAAAAGRELEYVPVLGAVRRGARPPKLEPLAKSVARTL